MKSSFGLVGSVALIPKLTQWSWLDLSTQGWPIQIHSHSHMDAYKWAQKCACASPPTHTHTHIQRERERERERERPLSVATHAKIPNKD